MEEKTVPVEKSTRIPSWIFYLLFFISGLVIGALTFYLLENTGTTTFLKQNTATESNNNDGSDNNGKTSTPTPLSMLPYTGTYFSGELPEGWTIVEYTNNSGSDMIMGGTTYSGLVGMKIFNQSNVEMFRLKAVDGIGGVEGCETVYRFSDSDQAYIDHGNDWTLATGIVPSNVVDLTSAEYTEYEVLGWEVRRVGNTLYRNMNPNLPGFNPACGIDVNLTIHNLAFNRVISGGTTQGNTYYMAISSTAVAAQLEDLDAVLESLSVN